MALVLENGVWKLQADGGAATPTTITMSPTSTHAHGTISDELLLSGGVWSGWTVQLPNGSCSLNESASGLRIDFNINVNSGPVTTTSGPINSGGIYREVTGDFDFSFVMESSDGSTYKNVAATAWNRDTYYRHVGSGTGSPYTAAIFNIAVGGNIIGGGQFGGAKGVLGAWNVGREFRIERSGSNINFYSRTIGAGSWTHRYPTGTETGYDIIATKARVGIMFANFGKNADDTIVVPNASLTYTP